MQSEDPSSPVDATPAEMTADPIHVNAEGDWYFQGRKIIREDLIETFLEHIRAGPDGTYRIEMGRSRCLLDAEDTPFVITRVDRSREEGTDRERILLRVRYCTKAETLDPATLYVGKEQVLYCRIRSGTFRARFSRPAYYELAQWIEEDPDSGGFCLRLHGVVFPIRGTG